MDTLYIPGTDSSPLVEYNPIGSVLKIEGKIIPENVEEVFKPINDWIDGYLRKNSELNILFRLYYYNTSSFKRVYNLSRKLSDCFDSGKKITARWEYLEDDEDSLRDAQELFEKATFPHSFVEVTE
ncbi:MAG: DUF1987 domain-containing protein [Bacteroidia bacterium]